VDPSPQSLDAEFAPTDYDPFKAFEKGTTTIRGVRGIGRSGKGSSGQEQLCTFTETQRLEGRKTGKQEHPVAEN